MSNKIFKQQIETVNQLVGYWLPRGARVLHMEATREIKYTPTPSGEIAMLQSHTVWVGCIWFLGDETLPRLSTEFYVAVDSGVLPHWATKETHVGSVSADGTVLHVFQKPGQSESTLAAIIVRG